jgi:hypothetical protein
MVRPDSNSRFHDGYIVGSAVPKAKIIYLIFYRGRPTCVQHDIAISVSKPRMCLSSFAMS